MDFHTGRDEPPTSPLRPIIPDNACTLRITAAAGTSLAGAYSKGTLTPKGFAPQHLAFIVYGVDYQGI